MTAARSGKPRGGGRFVLGLDFGTLSARAVLVDATGREWASAVCDYAHGVVEKVLPDGRRLTRDTALQDPDDYLMAVEAVVPRVLAEAGVAGEQVAGIGVDFTSCTMLPVFSDGTPLCREARWRRQPHAWVKLWKHHAAQPEADLINEVGRRRRERFLKVYGGRYSSEWFFSKLLETVRHAPAVYRAADRWIEAGDWLVWQLTGVERRSASAAGFKAMRVYPGRGGADWGYPSPAFFRALDPMLEDVVSRLEAPMVGVGEVAGELTDAMARRLGLPSGLPVAGASIDAHAAVPACTVTEPGRLVMILGTSTCHMLLGSEAREVEGMCGVVADGILPGCWGYEAGQSGVGDLFGWFVRESVPPGVVHEAERRGVSVHDVLSERAAALRPGETGLVALDWWSGNRSVLVDADLTGVLAGASIGTEPHEIYRALMEATAFGTRTIVEAFSDQGVPVEELYACGGLARRNPLLLQIYADVTGRPIRVAASDQASALGAAMQAAVASGLHPDFQTAARKMARLDRRIYRPRASASKVYDRVYGIYRELHDDLGRRVDSPLKRLKRIQRDVS